MLTINEEPDPKQQLASTVGGAPVIVDSAQIGLLFTALERRNYRVLGPTVRDGAIVYDQIRTVEDLPIGWTDRQDGGTYRLLRRDDDALFGYAVGPHSWKQFLFPPELLLWRARRTLDGGFSIDPEAEQSQPFAFIGVRSCELHAIAIQDRVFLGGNTVDPVYAARRERAFLVAVNCGHPAGTCFCVSMETGPRATTGFDLSLTEVIEQGPAPIGARRFCKRSHTALERSKNKWQAIAFLNWQPAKWAARWIHPASRSCSTATPSILVGPAWRRAA